MPLNKWDQATPNKITITLDTNVIIDIKHDDDINKLLKLHDEGKITIFKTDVVDTELQNTSSQSKSSAFDEDMGVAVIGSSRIGHAVIGGGDSQNEHDKMRLLLFPETKGRPPTENQTRDVMHLVTHKNHSRDIFVTKDNDFLSKKERLKNEYSIIVMNPKDCLDHIQKT